MLGIGYVKYWNHRREAPVNAFSRGYVASVPPTEGKVLINRDADIDDLDSFIKSNTSKFIVVQGEVINLHLVICIIS